MITRRVMLGSALVAAAAVGPAWAALARSGLPPRTINALLIDRTIPLPRTLAALIETDRQGMPVVDLTLDAGAHSALQQTLRASGAVVGISCGATLFCVERMAWDYGHRLTARTQRSSAASGDWDGDLAAIAGGGTVSQPPAYAPSRSDGLIHVWMIERKRSARSGSAGWL